MTVADITTFKRVLHSESHLFSILPEDSTEIEFFETSMEHTVMIVSRHLQVALNFNTNVFSFFAPPRT